MSAATHLKENQIFLMTLICAGWCGKFFRVCSVRSKVIIKTNFQGHWASGDMKIQNGQLEPKMVLIVGPSFVLVCVANFFICATPFPKLGPKTTHTWV